MAMQLDLTPQEKYVVDCIRELRPFEVVEIHKDQTGKPNRFRIRRSQEVIVNEITIAGVLLKK